MKNKKGTIILSIILAVQFLIPLSVWGYESYKNKELEEKGEEIKILVDTVFYDERGVVFKIEAIEEIINVGDNNFILFENTDDGFSKPVEISGLPQTDLYISENRLYNCYSEDWAFRYSSETTMEEYDYGYVDLYDRGVEQANINHGFSQGHETDAYAVFKIYKNRFKVVNVYIDETPVDTVIEKHKNGEWDTSRYEINYSNGIYYDYEFEDYYKEYYDEELDEYVTEPYVS